MENTDLTIGHALAYLEAEKKFRETDNLQQLPQSKLNQLNILRRRLTQLQSLPDFGKIFSEIPISECHSERPFLQKNQDLFLVLFLIDSDEKKLQQVCHRLSKHLNDCFPCFEIFCQVMRDYYHLITQFTQKLHLGAS